MAKMDIAEALVQMPELIDAAIRGEEVIITKNHQPVIKLVPISPSIKRRPPLFGSDKGRIIISDDFEDTLEEFGNYM